MSREANKQMDQPAWPTRKGRLLAGALLRAQQSTRLVRRIKLFSLITGIFEKEFLLVLYYLVFSYIAGAFPLVYSLFLLLKKGLSLTTFFEEKEHFLIFVGYSTFYLSVVINKQLLSIQNNLLRKWCLRRSGQNRLVRQYLDRPR